MRQLLLLITVFLNVIVVRGQTTFQKTYGGTSTDMGSSVQQTSDGGYIAVGITFSFSSGNQYFYLIKTNSTGDTLWTKTFGGINNDEGYSVQQTSDGGFIIAGYTNSFGVGNVDIYLIKTDSTGNMVWNKTIGGTVSEEAYSVQQTTDGGYIITGVTDSFGAGLEDVYLVKTDSIGNILWTKTYGGSNDDVGSSVYQTADGGYIVGGYTKSFGAGNYDFYLIKTDVSGNVQWTKTFGGINDEQSYSVQQTTDGGYVIIGYTNSFGAGFEDVYIIKTDTSGNTVWSKTYGGIYDDEGYSIQQTTDGGFILVGFTQSFGFGDYDTYLIRTDPTGNILWTRTFGGSNGDVGSSVKQTTDAGYIIVGRTENFGAGNYDFYLIKTDSIGNSGCNENNPATVSNNTTSIVTNPATLVSSGGSSTTPVPIILSGGMTNTVCFTSAINEVNESNSFNIFPNPFSFTTTLQTNIFLKNASLTIYNSIGQVVKQIDNLAGQTIIFNRGNLPSGLYFICITQDNKIIATDKLVMTDK